MKTLFSDPIHWTASAIGTKARFILVFVLLAGLTGFVVFEAANSGIRSAAGLALFMVWAQFMLLYAMGSMYLRLVGQSAAKRAAV